MVTSVETKNTPSSFIETLNRPPESENPLGLRINTITPKEFTAQGLDDYRSYVYAQYRADGIPQTVVSAKEGESCQAYYLLATQDQNRLPLNPDSYVHSNPETNSRYQKLFLDKFAQIAGFYRLEFGLPNPHQLTAAPIEAEALIEYSWQPDKWYAYISQLSFNPFLSVPNRAQVTRQIHHIGNQISEKVNGGHQVIAIMSPKVNAFVTRMAQVGTIREGGNLRWRNSDGTLTSVAQNIFIEYPGYWGKEDSLESDRPALYQILPFSLGTHE